MGVIFLVSVYAPTEASDLTVKDAFDATLESVVDQCHRRNTLRVLGDFNASTGTDRDGYETCFDPHGAGTVNLNCTKFLDFARSHGLRVAGSWFQRPYLDAHRRIKNKTCQRAEELVVSQRPSISSAQLCLWMSSCS